MTTSCKSPHAVTRPVMGRWLSRNDGIMACRFCGIDIKIGDVVITKPRSTRTTKAKARVYHEKCWNVLQL